MTLLLDVILPILVILIMTIVGLDLRYEDFLRVRQYPVFVPGVVIGQWIVLTIVAGLVGRALELPHAVAGGVLLFAAAPVATLSNFYTQLARGHLALAVTITAVSTVLAVVATPLIATAGFQLLLGQTAAFQLPPAKVAQQTLLGLLLPLLVGMSIRHWLEDWTLRWRTKLQVLGALAMFAVLGFVIVNQFEAIREQFAIFLSAALLFTLSMLAIGMLVARLLARSGDDSRALIWGFPARNVAVAALLATAAVGHGEMVSFSFVAVLFATQLAVLIPLGQWLNWRLNKRSPAGS